MFDDVGPIILVFGQSHQIVCPLDIRNSGQPTTLQEDIYIDGQDRQPTAGHHLLIHKHILNDSVFDHLQHIALLALNGHALPNEIPQQLVELIDAVVVDPLPILLQPLQSFIEEQYGSLEGDQVE